jgi:hypothetical protein
MKKIIYVLLVFLVCCTKSKDASIPEIPSCEVKELSAQEEATRKSPKPCPPNNPHCQDNPPPPPPPTDTSTTEKPGCILLDFDGHNYPGGLWGIARLFNSADITPDQKAAVLARVQSDYSAFTLLNVTTDEAIFNSYPAGYRARVIITADWQWYGQVGGTAFVGSYKWIQEEPCFVFSSLLYNNPKYISDATSHEAGHTLMCRHIMRCADGVVVLAYESGNGFEGPIMGAPYSATYPKLDWTGPSVTCDNFENSAQVILATLKK